MEKGESLMDKVKIGGRQFTLLVATFLIGSAALYGPSFLASAAAQDGWIICLLGMCGGFVIVWSYHALMSMYPSMTFIEINQKVLGRWIGGLTSLYFLFTFFVLTCAMVWSVSDFLITLVIPETPIIAVMTLFTIVSLIGAYYGIEVIARALEIFFPWLILFLLLIIIGIIPKIDLRNLQPILENGWTPVINGSFEFMSFTFFELVVFLSIYAQVIQEKVKTSFYIGLIIAEVCILIITLSSLLVLGPAIVADSTYATYLLGKKISIGEFFQQIEVVVGTLWLLSVFIKMEVSFYVFSNEFARLLGLKDYRSLLLPFGYLIICFSNIFWPNIVSYKEWVSLTWTPWIFAVGIILPMLLITVGKIRKRFS